MSKELEKVISRLSQKSKPVPKVEEDTEEASAEQEDLDELTKDEPEEAKEKTKEKEVIQTKIEELNAQIERLQNDGIYRVEMLFQRQQTNDYLKQIVDFLKKLGGEDGEEK
jgi:CHASE3 domain sensor protein